MKLLQEIQNIDQFDTIKNIENLCNSRDKFIKIYNDYAKIISDAMYKTKQGKGLKILTPEQMIQRLPIALAQVKPGNNSKNLLNEIRQIFFSLHQSNKITTRVYNRLTKSMQL